VGAVESFFVCRFKCFYMVCSNLPVGVAKAWPDHEETNMITSEWDWILRSNLPGNLSESLLRNNPVAFLHMLQFKFGLGNPTLNTLSREKRINQAISL
jgi:hypothetical protein